MKVTPSHSSRSIGLPAALIDASKLGRLATLGSLLLAVLLFCIVHHEHPARPTAGVVGNGWWFWFDQSHYLAAAQAFARFDFSPAAQNYEPGYAALAAPFVRLTPADPFFVPNLAALLLACWLFGGIGRRVVGPSFWVRPVSMFLFVLATVGDHQSAVVWAVPWTTTPMAPLLLGALLATLKFLEQPRPWPCFLAAFLSCAILAFRPGDAIVVTLPCAAMIVWALLRSWPGLHAGVAILLAGVAGAACALCPVIALHAAVWGLRESPYMISSKQIGFNLRLLPLRWVLIIVGPTPLTAGRGIVVVFPWVMSGIAGMLACLALPGREGRAPHLLLAATVAFSLVLFLSYRDLHPPGIWGMGNVHYFKWLLPFFALYTLAFVLALATSRRRIALLLIAASSAVALFCWRPELRTAAGAPPGIVQAPNRLTLPYGLPHIDDAVLVAGVGGWGDIYQGFYLAHGPHRSYEATVDFKAYPRPGGFLLIPLNPIGANATFIFPGVRLDLSTPPVLLRQELLFSPPCWLAYCAAELPPLAVRKVQ
jgi:hypothetical protein